MDIFEFEDDLEAKEKGIKIFLSGDKSAWLLIAAWGTASFWEAFRKNKETYCDDPEFPTDAESTKALAVTVADTVLLGWYGLTENDKAAKYSKEKAVEWLSDPAKERFFFRVQSEAQSVQRFKAKRIETEKKS